MDLIARLIREHEDYVLKLNSLADTLEGISVNGRGEYFAETLDGLLRPLTTELDDHAAREEEFLFPRLLERAPDAQVPVMLEEHQTIRALSADYGRWYPLWRRGDDAAFQPLAETALDLRGKFSAHMQKENLIVFPMARRIFTAEELAHLVE